MSPPSPPPSSPADQEQRRLARLRMLAVLDTGPEPVFDALVRIAAAVCGTPIALISLLDEERQWFKANHGLPGVTQTARELAFCDQAIRSDALMQVPDATQDPRFARNPLVTGDPNIRFYAGAPIAMPSGERIGTLCVIDRRPGELTPQQQDALRDLALVAQWALLQRERVHDLAVVGDESRFQAISYASPLGIFQADEQGAWFHVNGRALEMLGLPHDQALGLGWQDAVAADDQPALRERWRQAVAADELFDFEFRVRRPGGGSGHVRMQARPGRWGEPPRNGFIGVVGDITARKEAEQKQQQAYALLAEVVESLPCGLSVFDQELRLLVHNGKFRSLLDFPPVLFDRPAPRFEDFIRFNAQRGEYGRGEPESHVRRIVAQARAGTANHTQRERPDGTTLDIRAGPLPGGGFVTTYLDISAAKGVEKALRQSEERQKRALDASRLALWDLDLATDRMYLSENWSELLGGPRVPTAIKASELLELVPAEERQALTAALAAMLRGDSERYAMEHRVRRRDGSLVWIRSEGQVTERDALGRALHVTGTNQDITARKAADDEIRQAREAAEAANQAKSDFLDNVSHEIRTPLNGVLGLTRLLLADNLTEQQRKYVQLAEASAGSLLELINDLLDLGKIEAGRMELEDAPFRLDELLSQLDDLYRLRAQEKGLRFVLEVAAQVPAQVRGDAGRLRQILNNLLSNAFKFTAEGEVGLIVGRADPGRGPDMLRFTVYDTGIGIPYEVQPKLFSRFSQADSSTSRKYGGTGLGLAIVKQLCDQMGGTVLLQSEPGRGASFRCELPLAAARAPAPTQAPAPALRLPASPHGVRILVAEDNPTNQVVVRGLLAQAGYRDVKIVDDGLQAVSAAARDDFDLVLMDCRMPVMDGYAATRRLRSDGFTRPIIALTANASAGERDRCLLHGMNDYLTKPVDPQRLAQALAQWTGPGADAETDPAPDAAPAAAPEAARFDRNHALQRLGGDEELLAVALGSFREHAPKVLQAARTALDAGDAGALHRHLHSLAGSSAMVGAEPLREQAQALEAHAAEGRLAAAGDGLAPLGALFDEFVRVSADW